MYGPVTYRPYTHTHTHTHTMHILIALPIIALMVGLLALMVKENEQ
jgi:hypothetical protein